MFKIRMQKQGRLLAGAILSAMALCLVAPSQLRAVYTSRAAQTFTAEAGLTGGSVSMAISLKRGAGGTMADDSGGIIRFRNGGIDTFSVDTARSSGWRVADTFLEIAPVLTSASSGIQIYSDNRNLQARDASKQNYDPTIFANPAGLYIAKDGVANENQAKPLPVLWRVSTGTLTAAQISVRELISPTLTCTLEGAISALRYYHAGPADTTEANVFPVYNALLDKNTPDISCDPANVPFPKAAGVSGAVNAAPKASAIIDAEDGVHLAAGDQNFFRIRGTNVSGTDRYYLYLAADFTSAVAETYNANIVIEAYTE